LSTKHITPIKNDLTPLPRVESVSTNSNTESFIKSRKNNQSSELIGNKDWSNFASSGLKSHLKVPNSMNRNFQRYKTNETVREQPQTANTKFRLNTSSTAE